MIMVLLFYLAATFLITGILMVVFHAFRNRFLWGLGVVLFFPLLYPLYSLFNWSESQPRNGFLLSIASALLCAVALYGGAAKDLPIDQTGDLAERIPTASPPETPLPNEETAAQVQLPEGDRYDPIDRGSELEDVKIEPLAPTEDKSVRAETSAAARTFQTITIHQANQYLDVPARLTLTDGIQKQGQLAEVTTSSVSLQQKVSGGEVSLEYGYKDIERIEVLSSRPPLAIEIIDIHPEPESATQLEQPAEQPLEEADTAVPDAEPPTAGRPPAVEETGTIDTPETAPTDIIETPIPGTEETIFPPDAIPPVPVTAKPVRDAASDIQRGAADSIDDTSQEPAGEEQTVSPNPVESADTIPAE